MLVILGDINIHIDNISNPATKHLVSILIIFSLNQLVKSATHDGGHILDIVATNNVNIPLEKISTIDTASISDHYLVTFVIDCDYKSKNILKVL